MIHVLHLLFALLTVRSHGLETGHYVFESVAQPDTCTNSTSYAWIFNTEIEVLSLDPLEIYPHPCEATPWIKLNETVVPGDATYQKECFGVTLGFYPDPVDEEKALFSCVPTAVDGLRCDFTLLHEHDEEEHVEDQGATSEAWLYGISASVVISLVSLFGALGFLGRNNVFGKYQHDLLGLSAGTLIGAALFSILPEAYAVLGSGIDVGVTIVAGIMTGHILEVVLHTHKDGGVPEDKIELEPSEVVLHSHKDGGVPEDKIELEPSAQQEDSTDVEIQSDPAQALPKLHSDDYDSSSSPITTRMVLMNLVGDALHNIVDGVLVGAAFNSSTGVGLTTTWVVMLHELPQEISDFNLILGAGYSVKTAAGLNLLIGSTSVLGTIIALALAGDTISIEWCLPFSGGLFLYLAMGGVLPVLDALSHQSETSNVRRLVPIFIGLLIMGLLVLLPHSHSDEDHDDHDNH